MLLEGYAYNHLGERILRVPFGGDKQITLYDETGQWLGDHFESGRSQQAIWLDDYPVALISSADAGSPELVYIQPDHLGTPRVVVDPVRNTAIWEWSSKSEVFGNQMPNTDPDGDGVAFDLSLRFPGQQITDAGGTFYNYRREYDPFAGRYTQPDPIGLEGGLSTYGYADGNPLSLTDPFGLQAVRPPSFSRPGGGNAAQRRMAMRAHLNALQSNSRTTPIYSRGLSPEEVASTENAASLASEFDYTQYCSIEICRMSSDQCTSGDVMKGGFPSDPTVAQVNARGCICARTYYRNSPDPYSSEASKKWDDWVRALFIDALIHRGSRR